MAKKKSLEEYIRAEVAEVGMDKFKAQFGVTESTINHWARGACLPRPWQMEKIVELSKGSVSYEEMVTTFNEINKK